MRSALENKLTRWRYLLSLMLITLGVTLILTGCGEYSDTTGSGIVDNELQGITREAWFPMDSASVMQIGDASKSSPTNLYIGKQAGITSDIVIQFTSFTALYDSVASIDSTVLVMYGMGVVDTSSIQDTSAWSADVYRIDSDWEYTDMLYDFSMDTTLIAHIDSFGRYQVLYVDDDDTTANIDSVIVPIDNETMYSWVYDTLAYGLRIRPSEDAGFIKKFQSRYNATDASYLPVLQVTGTFIEFEIDGDDTTFTPYDTTLYVYSTITTYMTDDSYEVPDNRIVLEEGFGRNILLWTNLEQYFYDELGLVSEQLSINKAVLYMNQAPDSSDIVLSGMVLRVYDIEESWFEDPDSTTLGSVSSSSYALPDDTSLVRIDITTLARKWETYPDQNFGVAIRPYNQTSRLGRGIFYSTDADSAQRPWLRLIFTEYDLP